MSTKPTHFTIEDLYDLAWIEDVRLSPHSQSVAFVRVTVDRQANTYRRSICLVSLDGVLRRFTSGKHDTQPRWSPDGRRLAFVSTRDDAHGQLYVIELDGGEARQVTNLPNGASDPAWSPDGAYLACLSSVNAEECQQEEADQPAPTPQNAWEAQRAKEQRQHRDEQKRDPRVITRLPYRSATSFFDDRCRHIYLIELPTNEQEPPPTPRRLTRGELHYSPPVWMPDGQSVLTTASRDPDADSLFAYADVLRIPLTGAEPTRLTQAGFSYFDPQPSPDGSLIACCRVPEDRLLAEGHRVAIVPVAGGEPVDLTAHTDLNVEQFRWSPDGTGVLYLAGTQGAAHISVSGLPETQGYEQREALVGGSRLVSEFDLGRDGTIAFIAGSADNPCDLFVRRPDGNERQLTHLNQPLLAQRLVSPINEVRFAAPDGQVVQGWLIEPPDLKLDQTDAARSERKTPLVVFIHGGPHVMWGPGYRSMWHEWQTVAAAGYSVFFCNPRGSDGYGAVWRDAIRGRWGEADAPDLQAGIEHIIAQGRVDPTRIAVTGGSYGGYMTAWMLGHFDYFACGVILII